jgi:hypothetical protein
LEEVVEIVRFLCTCRPLRADVDIVDGRENVTLVLRDELVESFRVSGNGPPSSVVIAVVGVETVGNIGFDPRMVETEGFRRLFLSAALLLLRWRVDSDGRLGKGGGIANGGSVRARSSDV